MTTENIHIRPVTILDCMELAEISKKTFFDTFSAYNTAEDMTSYLAENYTFEKIEGEINDPCNTFFFAVENDIAVGFVKLRTSKTNPEFAETNAIEIERLYVSESYHGKKVGALLMKHCLHIAQSKNYDWIWLAVWEHNQKAQLFYDKWGFEKFGSQLFILGTDEQNDFLLKRKVVSNV